MEKEQEKGELWGLNWQDILVIFALWSINYVRPWFAGWHWFTYNLDLQRVASFKLVVLLCQCFMSVGLALICDVRHKKYMVYMYFLFFYGIFPAYGLLESILPSFTLRIMMDWLQSTSGIIIPIQFGAVFLQKPNISRMNCYIWLTIFEVVGALNAFVVPWMIPYNCPLHNAVIIPIWVVLWLAYWQVLLLVCYTLKYVKRETFHEKHLKAVIQGISQDCKVDNDVVWWRIRRKTMRFSILVLLLIPVLHAALLKESLKLIEVRKDSNMQHFITTSNMMPFGRFAGTAAVAAVLILIRRAWPEISDLLTLGVPHTLNLLALSIIIGRISGDHTGNVIEGTIPDKSSMVLFFINTDYNNRSACVYSEHFDPMRIRAMEYLTRVVRTDETEIEFVVVLDPTYGTFLPLRHVMAVRLGSFIIFMIQLGTIPLNRDFVVNAVQLIRVKGPENIRPAEAPQYVWLTSISEYVIETELRVSRGNGSAEVHKLPVIGEAIVESVPSVSTHVSVVHTSPIKEGNEFVLAEARGFPKPYTVYGVLIHEHNRVPSLAVEHQRVRPSTQNMWPSRTTVHAITLMKVRRPHHQRLPSRTILREDPVLAAAYFIHGAATSLVLVGFIHLFWKDAPLRLRTTLMAVFMVTIWLVVMLPDLKNIDYYNSGLGIMIFSPLTVSTLLIIQFAFILMHFLLAHLFYSAFPDNKLPTTSLSAYESFPDEPYKKPKW